MKLVEAAMSRSRKLMKLRELKQESPDSKVYWQAYCDFIDAEANLDAAIARADKANGTWELRVVRSDK